MKIVTVLFCATLAFLSSDTVRAQNCCNCPQTDTDMQCAAHCNAMIPRCKPQIPRSAPQGGNGGTASRAGMVYRCVPGGYVSGGNFCGSPPHACPPRSLPPVCRWVPY